MYQCRPTACWNWPVSEKRHRIIISSSSYRPNYQCRPTPDSNQSDTSFSHVTHWGNVEWVWSGVEKNTVRVKSENIPFPDFTRVDCGRPKIYPGVDPELYPRGRLRWLPESTPPSQDLPPPFIVIMWSVFGSQNLPVNPRIYHPFQQLYVSLPASTPPRIYTHFLSEYISPPVSTTICEFPRIYPSVTEYAPFL